MLPPSSRSSTICGRRGPLVGVPANADGRKCLAAHSKFGFLTGCIGWSGRRASNHRTPTWRRGALLQNPIWLGNQSLDHEDVRVADRVVDDPGDLLIALFRVEFRCLK